MIRSSEEGLKINPDGGGVVTSLLVLISTVQLLRTAVNLRTIHSLINHEAKGKVKIKRSQNSEKVTHVLWSLKDGGIKPLGEDCV